MRIEKNKKYSTIAVYCIVVFAICLTMVIAVFKFDGLKKLISDIVGVLSPVIWGMVIAYLLNPLMKFFERHIIKIFAKGDKTKIRKNVLRTSSLVLTILVAIAAIGASISVIIPQLTESISTLYLNLDTYFLNITTSANELFDKYPIILKLFPEMQEIVNKETNGLQDWLMNIISSTEVKNFFSTMTLGAYNAVIGVKDFLIGFIVSVYLLASKETFCAQAKKVMYALLPKKFCNNTLYVMRKADSTFIGFITGKALDSFIIGMICFVGITIMGTDNEVLISFIIGVTNMIPFFGPFVGAIPCALFILLTNPGKMLLFIIFIICLQQFDGNILGPKILGDSTGLPAFWVMFSILIGGGLFGFMGMLLGVPTFAVIYMLIRYFVRKRLKKKSLPVSTECYRENCVIQEVNAVSDTQVSGQLSFINDMDFTGEEKLDFLEPEKSDPKKSSFKISDLFKTKKKKR